MTKAGISPAASAAHFQSAPHRLPIRFEFATATRIIFGAGTLRQIGAAAAEMGHHVLVITGRTAARAPLLYESLTAQKIDYATFPISGEPTVETVKEGTRLAQAEKCDFVIGLGGGSVLDAGKAIAAMLTNSGDLYDYLEIIGRGQPLTQPSAPYLAIPTTAGTGAEVTRNAVLASPEHRIKVSLRSPLMLPRLALVDPELTYSLPPEITASTGLDTLTQLIEPYVSTRANPMTDALCREGMRRVGRSLRRAYETGSDIEARESMVLASLYGGLALANAGLGAVHGFAGPIGGMFPAPHGAVCASLLPHVMRINLRALRERQPASEALRRYEEIAQLLTGDEAATAEAGVAWIEELCQALHVPSLAAYGIMAEDFPVLIEKAAVASSMQANPIKLTPEEMQEILGRAL